LAASIGVPPAAKILGSNDTECGTINGVTAGKILRKMRANQTGWRIEDLQAVAEDNFVEWRRPGRGGSHVIFSTPGVREIVSVPSKRPIKPVYIKQFLKLLDAAGGDRTK
jgi:predicted RNA binding protein YcfA (HicA-like mRNA interferase family)